MKNLEKFEALQKEFESKIIENNNNIEQSIPVQEKNIFKENYLYTVDKIKKINKELGNLIDLKSTIGDVFLQILFLTIYFEKIQSQTEEYHKLINLLNSLFDPKSQINILLDKLETYLIIYNSTSSSDEEKISAKHMIKTILQDKLLVELKNLFNTKLKMITDDVKITFDDKGVPTIQDGNIYRNIHLTQDLIPDNNFTAYYGTLNRSGFIAQKSAIIIKRSKDDINKYKKYLNVTVPGLGLSNELFEHKPYSVNVLLSFNIHDYENRYLIENGDIENSDGLNTIYTWMSRYIRFGGIFSDQDMNDTGSQSVSIKINNDQSTKGYIDKIDDYKIEDFSVKAKFNNKDYCKESEMVIQYPLTGDNEKFADSIEIKQIVKSATTNAKYVLTGKLDFDVDLTNKKRDEDISFNQSIDQDIKTIDESESLTDDEKDKFKARYVSQKEKIGSYFTGTLKVQDINDEDAAPELNMTSQLASKDVIVKISTYLDTNDPSKVLCDIKCMVNTETNSNLIINPDTNEQDLLVLPTILSNFSYKSLLIDNKLIIDSPEDKILSNLLSLTNIQLDNSFDFNYSNFINNIQEQKELILEKILNNVRIIENLSKTVLSLSGIMPQYDDLYNGEYFSDISELFSKLTLKLTPFTTKTEQNIEKLYNGNLYDQILNINNQINVAIKESMIDILDAQSRLDGIKHKILSFNNITEFNEKSLLNTINTIYDIISGKSQSVQTLEHSGFELVSFPIISYYDWNTYYDLIPNGSKKDNRYFIDEFTKIMLYANSQIVINLNTKNDYVHFIKKYVKKIFMNTLIENIYSDSYALDIKPEYIKTIRQYKTLFNNYIINLDNINSDHINPYIYNLYPILSRFDSLDLNYLMTHDANNIGKSMIYMAILQDSSLVLDDKLYKIYSFLTNGQTLNFRELLFLISLLKVFNELKSDEDIKNYLSNILTIDINKAIIKYSSIFDILINMYKIYNETDNILDLFINKKVENPNLIAEPYTGKIKSKMTLYELISNNIYGSVDFSINENSGVNINEYK